MKHLIPVILLSLATPVLAWDNGDTGNNLWKQPEQQQRERNTWDRQQETYAQQNYDTYQYGPAVRHEEEMRRRGEAVTNMDRANRASLGSSQWQRQQQQQQHQRTR